MRSLYRRPRHVRGFSLIELGIVIAVIAVLGSVVILSTGYFRAARVKAGTDLIQTLYTSSRQWAIRYRSGLSYGQNTSKSKDNVSVEGLRGDGFIAVNLNAKDGSKGGTPWKGAEVTVSPDNVANATTCSGYTCVRIEISGVPMEGDQGETECDDVAKGFKSKAILATCANGKVTVVMR